MTRQKVVYVLIGWDLKGPDGVPFVRVFATEPPAIEERDRQRNYYRERGVWLWEVQMRVIEEKT